MAIVGYTNAGKSSLLGALSKCGDAAGVQDRLFATLDPTLRWGLDVLVRLGRAPPYVQLL